MKLPDSGCFSSALEARFEERRKEQQEDYEKKMAAYEAKREQGKHRGPKSHPPSNQPDNKAQYNFTDPESRIMKSGDHEHFEQAYNAQAAVDTEGRMLILGVHVTHAANDKQQLIPTLESENPATRTITEVLERFK